MARRVDIPRNKVFVGHDIVVAIPVVDEVTKLPQDLSTFALQFVVRDTPEGTVRLSRTVGIGTDNFNGTDDAALVPIYSTDTWDGVAILFSGKKHYTLRRADMGSEIPLAFGDIWFETIAGR